MPTNVRNLVSGEVSECLDLLPKLVISWCQWSDRNT